MGDIHKVVINEETIYLKNSKFFGWGVVYPIKIDGKINWKNLISGGNWNKLLIILFYLTILIGAIIEVSNIYQVANDCINASVNTIIP